MVPTRHLKTYEVAGPGCKLENQHYKCNCYLAFLDDVAASNISETLKMSRGPPVVLAEGRALKPVLWFPGDSVAAR